MKEWEDKYVEKYPIVGVLLGKGTAGAPDFVPAEGVSITDALLGDEQSGVKHADITKDVVAAAAAAADDDDGCPKCPHGVTNLGRFLGSVWAHWAHFVVGFGTGHALSAGESDSATFYCDGCGAKGLPMGTALHSCNECDYDLCKGCFSSFSRLGTPVRFSIDSDYFRLSFDRIGSILCRCGPLVPRRPAKSRTPRVKRDDRCIKSFVWFCSTTSLSQTLQSAFVSVLRNCYC